MSSVMVWMPRWRASARARSPLNPDESRSGNISPTTRSGPTARTARPAQHELSIPPDIATIKPALAQCLGDDRAQPLRDPANLSIGIDFEDGVSELFVLCHECS